MDEQEKARDPNLGAQLDPHALDGAGAD